jgi:hypothetical protein
MTISTMALSKTTDCTECARSDDQGMGKGLGTPKNRPRWLSDFSYERGHFYFGKNRTFLFWLDSLDFFLDIQMRVS